jgi:hypothetical protein
MLVTGSPNKSRLYNGGTECPAIRGRKSLEITTLQQHFDLIPHQVQGGIIYQRPKDGYINATAMCQSAGASIRSLP